MISLFQENERKKKTVIVQLFVHVLSIQQPKCQFVDF